jgi:beta-lactamase regulating signal transducer with metallopeptidase domain
VDTFAHDILLAWYRWMWAGGWQLAALVGVVLLIDPLLRRWVWPQVRLAVWLVLAAKLLLPPMLRSPVSVTAGFVDAYSVPLVAWGVADTLDQVLPYAPMRFLLEHGSACLMRRSEIGPPGLWLWGLAAIWLAGAVVVSGHFVRQMWRLRADARRPENSAEPWLVQLTARIAREAGLRRAPRVVVSDRVSCPALLCVFPTILIVPRSARPNHGGLEHMLLHACMHPPRRDHLVRVLLTGLQAVYWFNPLVWLIHRRISGLLEVCCDASVSARLGEATPGYRRTLLDLAERLCLPPRSPLVVGFSLFNDRHALIERLRWLERRPWRFRRRAQVAMAVVALGLLVFVVPMAPATAPYDCLGEPAQARAAD